MPPTSDERALHGVRVLDLAGEMGAYASKLLADMGADVIKVEPPDGDETRRLGPFAGDRHDAEHSLHFWHNNTNKRGVTLDLEHDAGRNALRRLADGAQILIESYAPGYLDSIGLGFQTLSATNPALVMTSVSGFGQGGPYAHFAASDAVCAAMSGLMYITGMPETPPVRAHGSQAYQTASLHAAFASLSALYEARDSGTGQQVDVSVQAAAATLTRLVGNYLSTGLVRTRQGSRDFFSYPTEIFPCQDGAAMIVVVAPDQWPRLVAWMASDEMAGDLADERYEDNQHRRDHYDHVRPLIAAWAMTHTADELFEGGQARRLPFGKMFNVADALNNPHLHARGFFVDVEHPDLGKTVRYPGAPYIFSETPWAIERLAPHLGEHNREILIAELGLTDHELAAATGDQTGPPSTRSTSSVKSGTARNAEGRAAANRAASTPQPPVPGPLTGITVADFSWVWAGPLSTRLLAEFGAEVIKIERPEARRIALERLRSFGAPAVGQMTNNLNRNKYGVTLDLKDDRGMAVVRRIIERSDIVVDNFSAGTMTRLGLGYEQLKAIKPDIIAYSLSGFGQTGPWSTFMSYGPTLQALAGLTDLTGYPDGPGAGVGEAYPDPTGGVHGALAALIALEYRRRTGRGQFIDVGQIQSTSAMLGTAVLDYSVNGHLQHRAGNRLVDRLAAPHGVYPCRGEDRWCAIGVFDDQQWLAFRGVLGEPPWARDPAYATIEGRVEHLDQLDHAVGEWTRERTAQEVMETLQSVGVPAGAVWDSRDLYETDPQLKHRGFWIDVEHPTLGPLVLDGIPSKLSRTPGGVRRLAPLPGDDNAYVLGELLGMPHEEIEALSTAGVI